MASVLNVGGLSGAVFRVVVALLAEDSGRFVAEVGKVDLQSSTLQVPMLGQGRTRRNSTANRCTPAWSCF
jgi:hypothetical protein